MRKVYKFQGQAPHLVPKDTKVLAVRLQTDRMTEQLTMWAEVSVNMKSDATLKVEVVPTGGNVPVGFTYVETEMVGPFVWHYYVKIEPH